jgi:hypothetical protein
MYSDAALYIAKHTSLHCSKLSYKPYFLVPNFKASFYLQISSFRIAICCVMLTRPLRQSALVTESPSIETLSFRRFGDFFCPPKFISRNTHAKTALAPIYLNHSSPRSLHENLLQTPLNFESYVARGNTQTDLFVSSSNAFLKRNSHAPTTTSSFHVLTTRQITVQYCGG